MIIIEKRFIMPFTLFLLSQCLFYLKYSIIKQLIISHQFGKLINQKSRKSNNLLKISTAEYLFACVV